MFGPASDAVRCRWLTFTPHIPGARVQELAMEETRDGLLVGILGLEAEALWAASPPTNDILSLGQMTSFFVDLPSAYRYRSVLRLRSPGG